MNSVDDLARADQRLTEDRYPARADALTAVAIFAAATVVAYLDRQLIYLLVGPMRRSLSITDSQIGLLQGLAFSLFFTLFAAPIGKLVDRRHRPGIMIFGVLAWSGATILGGFAQDFWELFAARAAVGVGEACLAPAAYSLIADYFPPRLRGRAVAAVTLCAAVGSGGSFFLGAGVMSLARDGMIQLPLLGAVASWRAAFILAGAPGPLVALLLLAVREPPRRERETAPPAAPGRRGSGSFLQMLRTHGNVLFYLYTAGGLIAMSSYAVASWMATYFIRHFAAKPTDIGWELGLVSIGAGVIGGAIGGVVSDVLAARRGGERIDNYAISGVISLPFVIGWTLTGNPTLALALVTCVLVSFNMSVATSGALLQEVVPNQLRGQAIAGYYIVLGIVATGLGPLSVALVTDYVFHDDAAVGASIVWVSAPLAALSAIVAIAGRKTYAASLKRSEF